MKLLRNTLLTDPVALATDAAAFALPPGSFGMVPSWWNGASGTVPEFELELWAGEAISVTNAVLYGATLHPRTYADKVFTAELAVKASLDLATKTVNCNTVIEAKVAGDAGNGITIAFVQSGAAPNSGALTHIGLAYTFTFKNGVTTVTNFQTAVTASADLAVKTPGTGATLLVTAVDEFGAANLAGGDDTSLVAVAHDLETGDGPLRVASTLTLAAPLEAAKDYWAVKDGTGEFGLAESLADAMAGVVVALTDVGSGVQTLSDTSETQRVTWQTHDGLLGLAGDGAIALDSQVGYRKVIPHSPRVFAYALVATLDTGTASAAIVPRADA